MSLYFGFVILIVCLAVDERGGDAAVQVALKAAAVLLEPLAQSLSFCANKVQKKKSMEPQYPLPDTLEQWYFEMEKMEQFQMWYFGHMHVDQEITEKLLGVYHKFVEI